MELCLGFVRILSQTCLIQVSISYLKRPVVGVGSKIRSCKVGVVPRNIKLGIKCLLVGFLQQTRGLMEESRE